MCYHYVCTFFKVVKLFILHIIINTYSNTVHRLCLFTRAKGLELSGYLENVHKIVLHTNFFVLSLVLCV